MRGLDDISQSGTLYEVRFSPETTRNLNQLKETTDTNEILRILVRLFKTYEVLRWEPIRYDEHSGNMVDYGWRTHEKQGGEPLVVDKVPNVELPLGFELDGEQFVLYDSPSVYTSDSTGGGWVGGGVRIAQLHWCGTLG
jgi:hypothetical protein